MGLDPLKNIHCQPKTYFFTFLLVLISGLCLSVANAVEDVETQIDENGIEQLVDTGVLNAFEKDLKNDPGAIRDLQIDIDLSWSERGGSQSTVTGSSEAWDIRFHEVTSFKTRVYRVFNQYGDNRYAILVAPKTVHMTPRGFMVSYQNSFLGPYRQTSFENSGGAGHIENLEIEQGPGALSRGGDLFGIKFSSAWQLVARNPNDGNPKSFAPGGSQAPFTPFVPLSIGSFSYDALKKHSVTLPIDVKEIRPLATYGGAGSNELRVTGSATFTMGSTHCNPLEDMKEGQDKDYVISEHPKGEDLSLRNMGRTFRKKGRPFIEFNKKYWESATPGFRNAIAAHELKHREQYLKGVLPLAGEWGSKEYRTHAFLKEYDAYVAEALYIMNCVDMSKLKPWEAHQMRGILKLIFHDNKLRALGDVWFDLMDRYGHPDL